MADKDSIVQNSVDWKFVGNSANYQSRALFLWGLRTRVDFSGRALREDFCISTLAWALVCLALESSLTLSSA